MDPSNQIPAPLLPPSPHSIPSNASINSLLASPSPSPEDRNAKRMVVAIILVAIIGCFGFLFYHFIYTSEYFNPQNIDYTDTRLEPAHKELLAWETSLVDSDWKAVAGNDPADEDLEDSPLSDGSEVRFPRDNATSPKVTGWLSQERRNSDSYYVNLLLYREWKPSFTTVEAFKAWAEEHFLDGELVCVDNMSCTLEQTRSGAGGKTYTICFDAEKSPCGGIFYAEEGPSIVFMLTLEKSYGAWAR